MADEEREMVKTSLYVPASLVERARRVAARQDRTFTQVVRRAIESGIESAEREPVEAAV